MEENKQIETGKESFTGWTAYDDWISEHGQELSVYDLQEKDGNITIKYCKREDFKALKATL